MTDYRGTIRDYLTLTIQETDLKLKTADKKVGKVRDIYISHGEEKEQIILLVTTDRVSAFDRVLASVPLKGQVLTQVAAWWFQKTQDIIPNHLISTPDPNVIAGKACKGGAILV